MTRKLLEQALEALGTCGVGDYRDVGGEWCERHWHDEEMVMLAKSAIRAHLAKPQGEPVAWLYDIPNYKHVSSVDRIPMDMCPTGTTESPLNTHPAHTEQEVQELLFVERLGAEAAIRRILGVPAT